MSFISEWLKEFDQEMATTRRVIERVPSDKGPWKPHPKSFAIGHLAQLLAGMPGWSGFVARGDNLDLSKAPGYSFEPTEKRSALRSTGSRKSHASASDALLEWTAACCWRSAIGSPK